MDCECINPIGGKPNNTPRIIHVFGNVLRVAIPLTLRNVVKDGDEIVVTVIGDFPDVFVEDLFRVAAEFPLP